MGKEPVCLSLCTVASCQFREIASGTYLQSYSSGLLKIRY